MGIYHAATVPKDLTEEADGVREDVLGVARKVMVSEAKVRDLMIDVDWHSRVAGSFGDFGPGNVHCSKAGEMYLLDPPDQRRINLIHRDIANFLFESRRQLAGRGGTRSRPVRGRHSALRSSFLDGYRWGWPGEPLSADDEALIALFEARRAFGMSRKRWPRWYRDSLWFGGLALARRYEVTRSGRRAALEDNPS